MKILILDPEKKVTHRISKDTSGGKFDGEKFECLVYNKQCVLSSRDSNITPNITGKCPKCEDSTGKARIRDGNFIEWDTMPAKCGCKNQNKMALSALRPLRSRQ